MKTVITRPGWVNTSTTVQTSYSFDTGSPHVTACVQKNGEHYSVFVRSGKSGYLSMGRRKLHEAMECAEDRCS